MSTQTNPDPSKYLAGAISFDYKWNPGSTVGRFLTDLRDKKEITGVRCTKTSKVFVPPQKWSPFGNIKMDRFVTMSSEPVLKAGTIVYKEVWNAPQGLTPPYMLGAVGFAEADTELVHLIKGSEDELKKLKPGDKLKAVWREEPQGDIRDLQYFVPA